MALRLLVDWGLPLLVNVHLPSPQACSPSALDSQPDGLCAALINSSTHRHFGLAFFNGQQEGAFSFLQSPSRSKAAHFPSLNPCPRLFDHLGALRSQQCTRRYQHQNNFLGRTSLTALCAPFISSPSC
jgi:hypothetical protein